jgi:hypothetical protein
VAACVGMLDGVSVTALSSVTMVMKNKQEIKIYIGEKASKLGRKSHSVTCDDAYKKFHINKV